MRLIDADQLLDFIKFDKKVIAPEEHTAEDIVMMIHTAPTITPPPNDPLTLEELRGMVGEPVWAVLQLPTNGIKEGWALVDTRHGYAATQQGWASWTLWYDEYGKTWLAYRRKPEEGTKDGLQ